METIKIKKYSDLKTLDKTKLTEYVTFDLKELPIKEKERVLDFLSGLTFLNGSLRKIDKDQFEVKVNKNTIYYNNPYYEDLDDGVKEGLELKKQFDSLSYKKETLIKYNVQIDLEKISYITMDTFGHIIVLTEDNNLYIDNVLYKKGVKKIIEFVKTDLIFILDNNEVEYYSRKNSLVKKVEKYDKVLYADDFLAKLKNKHLVVYYRPVVGDNCNFIEDETFDVGFWGVDDISLREEVVVGNEKIIFLNIEKDGRIIESPFIVGKLS